MYPSWIEQSISPECLIYQCNRKNVIPGFSQGCRKVARRVIRLMVINILAFMNALSAQSNDPYKRNRSFFLFYLFCLNMTTG